MALTEKVSDNGQLNSGIVIVCLVLINEEPTLTHDFVSQEVPREVSFTAKDTRLVAG